MFYKILSEDSEKTIVKVNTFSNKNKNIHLICDPDFDSIGICSISNIWRNNGCSINSKTILITNKPTYVNLKTEEKYIRSLFISLNALKDAAATIKLKNIIMRRETTIANKNSALAPISLAIDCVVSPGTTNMLPSNINSNEVIIVLPNNPTPAFLAHKGLDSRIALFIYISPIFNYNFFS